MRWLGLVFLVACAGGGSGDGQITTNPGAPWSMDAASAFLWLVGDENDGREGTGVLAIGTGEFNCAAANAGPPGDGSGLWMALSYFTGQDASQPGPAWDGLYVHGAGGDAETPAEKSMQLSGWHDGTVYDFAGGDAWVKVEEGRTNEFRGSFATTWWYGGFDARVCGDEKASDTGS